MNLKLQKNEIKREIFGGPEGIKFFNYGTNFMKKRRTSRKSKAENFKTLNLKL